VKDLVGRGRPADLLAGVEGRESGIHGAGYVSGHTAVAFALATMVAPLFPSGWRWVPFGLARSWASPASTTAPTCRST
jgi:glycosyltransferase 2 family protein